MSSLVTAAGLALGSTHGHSGSPVLLVAAAVCVVKMVAYCATVHRLKAADGAMGHQTSGVAIFATSTSAEDQMGTFGTAEWARHFSVSAATALDLSSTPQAINWRSLAAGLQHAGSNTPLTDLNLKDTGVGPEVAIAVAAWANAKPGRTAQLDDIVDSVLDLTGRGLSDADLTGLVRTLASSTAITSVNLAGNNFDQGFEALTAMLAANTTISSIGLENTGMDLEAALAVAAWMGAKPGRTAQVDGEFNVYLCAAVNDPSVKKLNLSRNVLSGAEVEAITAMLASNTTITSGNLAGNDLSERSIKAITAMLASNTTITSIDFARNRLDSLKQGSIEAITAMLASNTTITSVNLAGNDLSERSIKAITAMLASNTTITSIDLNNTGIDLEAAIAVAAWADAEPGRTALLDDVVLTDGDVVLSAGAYESEDDDSDSVYNSSESDDE